MKELLQSLMRELKIVGLELLEILSLVPKSQLQKKEKELQDYREDMDKFRDQVIESYRPVMITIPKGQGRDMAELKLQAGLKLLEEVSDQNLIHYLITEERVVAQMDLLLLANNLFGAKDEKTNRVDSNREK